MFDYRVQKNVKFIITQINNSTYLKFKYIYFFIGAGVRRGFGIGYLDYISSLLYCTLNLFAFFV